MRMIISVASMTAMLSSCSTPPKLPTVDETTRRPANSATAVERQACTHELQNTRLLAAESDRWVVSMSAASANMAALQQALAGHRPAEPPVALGNTVLMVHFKYGSTRVDIPIDVEKELVAQARSVPLILLRGRTDGLVDSLAESRIARARADAVRDYLVAAGVDASRIKTTYQPSGDHVADNTGAGGQALNRRVEIEFYRTLPVPLSAGHW